MCRPDGSVRWLLKRGTLVRAIDGKPLRLIGTLTDITALKHGQRVLRRTHRQIRDLTGRLVAAQEGERRRIARELHDDVNQRLAGASISLSNLQASLVASTPRVLRRMTQLQTEIRELIVGIRRISHELHPGVLEHAGLEAALRSLCHDFGSKHGIAIDVEIYDLIEPLPGHIALCCYRVVQEALRNLAQRPRVPACAVRLYQEGGSLVLSVRDGAVGPDRLQWGAGDDFDLISMRGRARLLGGRLRVVSRPGRRAELRAFIPVPPERPE
jgi:signal transduction histidine kinase